MSILLDEILINIFTFSCNSILNIRLASRRFLELSLITHVCDSKHQFNMILRYGTIESLRKLKDYKLELRYYQLIVFTYNNHKLLKEIIDDIPIDSLTYFINRSCLTHEYLECFEIIIKKSVELKLIDIRTLKDAYTYKSEEYALILCKYNRYCVIELCNLKFYKCIEYITLNLPLLCDDKIYLYSKSYLLNDNCFDKLICLYHTLDEHYNCVIKLLFINDHLHRIPQILSKFKLDNTMKYNYRMHFSTNYDMCYRSLQYDTIKHLFSDPLKLATKYSSLEIIKLFSIYSKDSHALYSAVQRGNNIIFDYILSLQNILITQKCLSKAIELNNHYIINSLSNIIQIKDS
jgi:hypothetical protein